MNLLWDDATLQPQVSFPRVSDALECMFIFKEEPPLPPVRLKMPGGKACFVLETEFQLFLPTNLWVSDLSPALPCSESSLSRSCPGWLKHSRCWCWCWCCVDVRVTVMCATEVGMSVARHPQTRQKHNQNPPSANNGGWKKKAAKSGWEASNMKGNPI